MNVQNLICIYALTNRDQSVCIQASLNVQNLICIYKMICLHENFSPTKVGQITKYVKYN